VDSPLFSPVLVRSTLVKFPVLNCLCLCHVTIFLVFFFRCFVVFDTILALPFTLSLTRIESRTYGLLMRVHHSATIQVCFLPPHHHHHRLHLFFLSDAEVYIFLNFYYLLFHDLYYQVSCAVFSRLSLYFPTKP
jgi:hypothetical protein